MVQQEKERYLAGERASLSSDGTKDSIMMIDPSGSTTIDADADDAILDSIDNDLGSSSGGSNIISDAMMMMMMEEPSSAVGGTAAPTAAAAIVSADIVQMDSVIQEKEEILSKLLDTVKGR